MSRTFFGLYGRVCQSGEALNDDQSASGQSQRKRRLLSQSGLGWRGWLLIGCWISLVSAFGLTQPAYGYIDPATTSYIIQIVSGLIISLSVAFGVFFQRIQMFLVTARARLAALWVRLTSKKQRQLRRQKRSHGRLERAGKSSASKVGEPERKTGVLARSSRSGVVAPSSRAEATASGGKVATGAANGRSGAQASGGKTGQKQGRGAAKADPPQSKKAFLLGETRSFRQRLGMAALLAAALAFSFIFFGICDLVTVNQSTLPYSLSDILGAVVLESLIVFAALTLLMLLMRGRLFDYLLSFFFGLLVMLYVQGNFMNISLGQLNGDSIPWDWYLDHALINTLVCSLIMLLPFVLRFFSAKIWQTAVVFLPALLIVMQLLSLLTSLSTSTTLSASPKEDSYLSDAGLYQVSENHNVLVFVLDRMDDRYINQALAEEPNFFNGKLDGFTRYTNNLSTHSRTYPSVINMLTGANYYFEQPSQSFTHQAYQDSSFLPQLHEQGYTNYLYTERNSGYFKGNDLAGLADNVQTGTLVIDATAALQKLTILSFYRYVPHALKPSFWLSTDAFYDDATYQGEHQLYQIDDAAFYERLKDQQLQVNDALADGVFHFIHLQGPHAPYTLAEDGSRLTGGTSSVTVQLRASMRIVFEYLDQLKRLGLYKDATVIITADHGYPSEGYTSDWHPMREAVFTGLFYKPAGSSGSALKISTEPTNSDSLRSTILDEIGVKASAVENDPTLSAPTYRECSAATVPERQYFFRIGERGVADYSLEQLSVGPEARSFSNWKVVGIWPIHYWQY